MSEKSDADVANASTVPEDSDDSLLKLIAHAPAVTTPLARDVVLPQMEDCTDLPTIDPDRYAIGGEIARGGMGHILAAQDRRLGRTVAIKQHAAGTAATRFIREALITARLQHPAIVPIYEAGRLPSGRPFYAMRLIPGKPLDHEVRNRRRLADRMALLPNVLAAVDAVAYAHTNRVIHRDLKPANVLVGEFGETVVIDWGLAKSLDDQSPAVTDAGPYRDQAEAETREGSVIGTPAFMAPEQARGEAADERADVYSLGALLYYVLAGLSPARGSSVEEILKQTMSGAIEPMSIVEPAVPEDLAAVVSKAMALDPAQRYPDATAVAVDLKRFQTGQLVGAHRYSTWQLITRQIRSHRAAFSVGAVLAVILAIVSAYSVHRIIRERDVANQQRDIATKRKMSAEKLVDFFLGDLKTQLAKLDTVKIFEVDDDTGSPIDKRMQMSEQQARLLRKAAMLVRTRESHAQLERPASNESSHAADANGFGGAAAMKPQNDSSVYMRRMSAGLREDYHPAEQLLDEVLAADRDNDKALQQVAEAHSYIGGIYLKQGDAENALSSFRRMVGVLRDRFDGNRHDQNWGKLLARGYGLIAEADDKLPRRETEARASLEEAVTVLRILQFEKRLDKEGVSMLDSFVNRLSRLNSHASP